MAHACQKKPGEILTFRQSLQDAGAATAIFVTGSAPEAEEVLCQLFSITKTTCLRAKVRERRAPHHAKGEPVDDDTGPVGYALHQYYPDLVD